jgi:hypothetical protein
MRQGHAPVRLSRPRAPGNVERGAEARPAAPKRDTDGVMFPVTPEKAAALAARMEALGIREAELDEQFVRSGGKGG